MKTSEEIAAEIARLKTEGDSTYEREAAGRLARDEAERRAKGEREGAVIKEGAERERAYLRQSLEVVEAKPPPVEALTCYRPATGTLGELGLCATFLGTMNNDAQPIDACWQCQYGHGNPNYHPGLIYARGG